MAKAIHKSNHKKENEENSSLKGTLVSVLCLGLFIIITWVSVYFLFIERF